LGGVCRRPKTAVRGRLSDPPMGNGRGPRLKKKKKVVREIQWTCTNLLGLNKKGVTTQPGQKNRGTYQASSKKLGKGIVGGRGGERHPPKEPNKADSENGGKKVVVEKGGSRSKNNLESKKKRKGARWNIPPRVLSGQKVEMYKGERIGKKVSNRFTVIPPT